MQLQLLDDAAEFLSRAEPLLLADEARHNLLLGIAGTIRDQPGHYPEHRFWLVLDGNEPAAAALRTPPFNLVVAGPAAALETLAEQLDEELPGVVGALPEIDAFARTWEARRGVAREVTVSQGIYALDGLIEPAQPRERPARRPKTIASSSSSGCATSRARRIARRSPSRRSTSA